MRTYSIYADNSCTFRKMLIWRLPFPSWNGFALAPIVRGLRRQGSAISQCFAHVPLLSGDLRGRRVGCHARWLLVHRVYNNSVHKQLCWAQPARWRSRRFDETSGRSIWLASGCNARATWKRIERSYKSAWFLGSNVAGFYPHRSPTAHTTWL